MIDMVARHILKLITGIEQPTTAANLGISIAVMLVSSPLISYLLRHFPIMLGKPTKTKIA